MIRSKKLLLSEGCKWHKPSFSFDDEEDEDDKEEVAANEAVFGSGGGWPFLSRVRGV